MVDLKDLGTDYWLIDKTRNKSFKVKVIFLSELSSVIDSYDMDRWPNISDYFSHVSATLVCGSPVYWYINYEEHIDLGGVVALAVKDGKDTLIIDDKFELQLD